MPGVRINQLLASTAVVLLLAGAPAVTLAGPNDSGANAAAAAPTPADADKAAAVDSDTATARFAGPAGDHGIDIARYGGADPCPGGSGRACGDCRNPQRPPARLRRLHRRSAGCARLERGRCRGRRSAAQSLQRQVRPHRRQQERPHHRRCVLFRPRLRAAVDHRRQGERARQGRDRLSRPCRRRTVSIRPITRCRTFPRSAIRATSPRPSSSST